MPNDLLAKFGLAPKDAPKVTAPIADAPESAEPPGPTALDIDRFDARRGREWLTGDMGPRLAATDFSAEPDRPHAAADLLAAAYEPAPELLPACQDRVRHEFLKTLMEQDTYSALHTSTQLDTFCSELAALAFADQLAQLRAARAKPEPPDDPPGSASVRREAQCIAAVAAALKTAKEEVDAAAGMAHACGMGDGVSGSPLDPRRVGALYRRVKDNPKLRRIVELAGAFRRVAAARQRTKPSHGYDDMVGVTLGDDVGRLVGSELSQIALPELADDVMRRLVEKQAVVREHRSMEPAGRGPVIVVVDESGSMGGSKIETAKAFALAVAWVAKQQRRWCGLVAFSGNSGHRLLALPPGRWDESAVADWLVGFIGGGSCRDVPLVEMPEFYRQLGAPHRKTDVLFVTDAICSVEPRIRDAFLTWKATVGARVYSLIIQSEPGDLAAVSDECHTVDAIAVGDPAVGDALAY